MIFFGKIFRDYLKFQKLREKFKSEQKNFILNQINSLLELDWKDFLKNFVRFIEDLYNFQNIDLKDKNSNLIKDFKGFLIFIWLNDWQIRKIEKFIYKDEVDHKLVEELKTSLASWYKKLTE